MFHLTISAAEQRRHLHGFWHLGRGFWQGATARLAWSLAGLLLAAVLLQLAVQYRLNLWNRDFFDALERGDAAGIWWQALLFLPLALLSTASVVLVTWGRMTAQRKWRGWTTERLIAIWSSSRRYRELTVLTGEHRNPEYRVAEDVRIATELPIDFGIGLLGSLLGALTFIGVLWSIGGDLVIEIGGELWHLPAYMVLAVVLYSLFTTTVTMVFGDHLVPMVEEKNQAESELRFAATRLREATERDGFRFAQAPELADLGSALAAVLAGWRKLCGQLMRTAFVAQANTVLAPVVGLLLCVPKYLVNAMSLGEVVQAAAAFVIVQAAFNWLVDNYPRLADWLSSVNRVAQLLDWLDGPAQVAPAPLASVREAPAVLD